MTDVTADNFDELWPHIQRNIDQAVLVGIDSEFSGIVASPKLKNSLFDTMPERYTLQRQNISPFTITQFGLTLFVRATEPNAYVAHPYNFYLCPPSFGRLDPRFSCQASSLQFLRRYGFDFNKFIYGGIPFLHAEDEAMLKADIKDRSMWSVKDRVNVDERFIQERCSAVSHWLSDASPDAPAAWSEEVRELSLRYLLQKELRRRFADVWTSSHGSQVLVTRVTPAMRCDLEATDDLDQWLVTSLVGFTRVMRHLRVRQKPMVGHNCMLDLMLIHHLFIGPLPKEYHRFKAEIHSWFPEVYDTRHIVHSVKDMCSEEVSALLDTSSLLSLHRSLGSRALLAAVLHTPAIWLTDAASRYKKEAAHEAGYDAFAAGCCLLRMAHLIAHRDASSFSHRPLSVREHLAALSQNKNHVNVIRATVNHMCLDGPDPRTERPRWFHLAARGGGSLNVPEVVELLSQYGAVDVRPCSARQALVAVGNYRCAKDVMDAFRKDKRYTIAQYSALKHSALVRTLLWSGVAVSTGLGAVLLLSQLRRTSS
ncbi:pre-piRNA 3'-exonuclease trimmer-like isoform X2 [Pollicipes pollicipes]|uniref:pre-piRNA 3'-exonuclease trimmer-like isoform X2 n=1 Tax=Pollicipes pollicipes TaxID=41117 RepID=UPI0018853DAB|nr:pre-piRNA 3'-exonuclease trimmer-like isoform X2 [Pollicipes pollicipes]